MIFKETLEEKSRVIWDRRGGREQSPCVDPGGSPVGKGEGGHGLWSSEEGHVDQRGIRGGGQQEPDPAGPQGPPLGGSGFIPEAPWSHRRLKSRGVMRSDPTDDSDLGVLQEEGLEEARDWAVLTQTMTALGSVPLPTFLFSVSLPLLPASSLSLRSDRPVSLVLTHLPLSPSLPPSLHFPEQNSNSSSPRWLALAPFGLAELIILIKLWDLFY